MVAPGYFLFGSAARGDADEFSDVDVLIIYWSEPSLPDRERAKASAQMQLGKECAFAEYTWDRLRAIFADGHLFAWHLYQEAIPLRETSRSGRAFAFPKPEPYRSARTDAMNFASLLQTCLRAVESRTASLTYEAGLAYVALRNVGMSLSALALPKPEFDRHVPFKLARALGTSPPCRADVYDLMIAARHSSQRGTVAPSLDSEVLTPALVWAHRWVARVLEAVDDVTSV